MSQVFENYSKYYDLIYQDKDYQGEVEYLLQLIQSHQTLASTKILDLGCGTGRHDEILSQRGFEVLGVDISETMLKEANKLSRNGLSFESGDIRNFRTEQKFDIVTSLFHVMNYQTSNQDLSDSFQTISHHLNSEGLFIFDTWYGPSVLMDPPQNPFREWSNSELKVSRQTHSEMVTKANTVEVKFDLTIEDFDLQKTYSLQETHPMRYLFLPEIKQYLSNSGLEFIQAYQWMTLDPISDQSWYGVIVAKKP